MTRTVAFLAAFLVGLSLHAQSARSGESPASARPDSPYRVEAEPSSESEARIRRRKSDAALVLRDRQAPLEAKADGAIWQDGKFIGMVEILAGGSQGMQRFSVTLPDGTPVAELSYESMDAGVDFTVKTHVDGIWHPVHQESTNAFRAGTESLDPGLRRVLPWLVEQGYW